MDTAGRLATVEVLCEKTVCVLSCRQTPFEQMCVTREKWGLKIVILVRQEWKTFLERYTKALIGDLEVFKGFSWYHGVTRVR